MIVLYTQQISERLQYIVQTILNPDIIISCDLENYKGYDGLKINYSAKRILPEELHIRPFGLMTETEIQLHEWECISWNNLTAFCMVADADIPFDIFSASFYLLSRYEEYLPHEKDEYGRYHHKNSIAFKHHFLDSPIVNLWWIELDKIWKKKLKTSVSLLKTTSFKYIPTYDIDVVYQCKGNKLSYNLLSLCASMLKCRMGDVKNKLQYLTKGIDAFDTFGWLDHEHKQHGLQPVYFLLTLLQKGIHDKNLYANNAALQELYRELSEQYTIGIHPSWQSGDIEPLMGEEMECLQNIIEKPITLSRFHFLRFTIPDYYHKLIGLGIKEDFSMAYGGKNGFRASYANPFYWYDLHHETITDLLIHPFSFMEATAHFTEHKTAEQAYHQMSEQYDLVKRINGEFITLFHNHFLVDDAEWRPWRNMYKTFLNNKYSY